MKKLLAILLTLAVLLSLASCSGGDPNAGKYLGLRKNYSSNGETPYVYKTNTWMELKSGGKGSAAISGVFVKLTWLVEGDTITVTIGGIENIGTLEDGLITINLLDMGEMLFLKEGLEFPAPKVTYNDAGYWELVRIDSENPEYRVPEEYMEIFRNSGILMYMDLKNDGTGVLNINEEIDLTWQDGTITLPGEDLTGSYTLENGQLVLNLAEMVCVFRAAEKP